MTPEERVRQLFMKWEATGDSLRMKYVFGDDIADAIRAAVEADREASCKLICHWCAKAGKDVRGKLRDGTLDKFAVQSAELENERWLHVVANWQGYLGKEECKAQIIRAQGGSH